MLRFSAFESQITLLRAISLVTCLILCCLPATAQQQSAPSQYATLVLPSPLTAGHLRGVPTATIIRHLEALQESDQNEPLQLLEDIRVIIKFAQESGLESLEIEAISAEVLIHSALNDTPEVERLVDLHLPRTVNIGSLTALSRLYRAALRATVITGDKDKAVAIKRQLGQLLTQGLPPRQEGLVYLSIGTADYFAREYFSAIQYLRRAQDIFVKQGLRVDEDRVLGILAVVNSKLGNEQRAIEIQLSIAQRMRQGAKTLNWSIVDFNIARSYFDLENYEKSLFYVQRSRDIAQELNDSVGVAYANELIARINLEQQRYAAAIALADSAAAMFANANDAEKQLDALISKAKAQLMLEQMVEVETTLALISDLQQQVQLAKSNAEISEMLALYYSKQGDYVKALEYFRHFHHQYVDLELKGRGEAIERMMAEFTSEAQESENRFLAQQNVLNQIQLKERKRQQTFLTIAIALSTLVVITIVLLLFWQWRKSGLMRDLALTDELTQAPNRRACLSAAKLAFNQANAGHYSMVLAMIDLDHFKAINDKFGHDTGDEVLKVFAAAVQSVLRDADLYGRMGGEEWLLIFPHSDLLHVDGIFTRLREAFQTLARQARLSVDTLTFSMGAVSSLDNFQSVEAMITQADKLVYQAKSNGRDRLEIQLATNKA
ncbi:sensor domain-containing diguanylate cyclase [Alteromonas flava]|uniref:GGDEF domain-containing protein n=1 Tax=Alteromonas flava TaxID=2048003 RepID=UPI000F5DD47C|nr:GGDEF domain-containing protein [Alteromonas flava]